MRPAFHLLLKVIVESFHLHVYTLLDVFYFVLEYTCFLVLEWFSNFTAFLHLHTSVSLLHFLQMWEIKGV